MRSELVDRFHTWSANDQHRVRRGMTWPIKQESQSRETDEFGHSGRVEKGVACVVASITLLSCPQPGISSHSTCSVTAAHIVAKMETHDNCGMIGRADNTTASSRVFCSPRPRMPYGSVFLCIKCQELASQFASGSGRCFGIIVQPSYAASSVAALH